MIKHKYFTCHCSSDKCRYNKSNIQSFLKEYYNRIGEPMPVPESPKSEAKPEAKPETEKKEPAKEEPKVENGDATAESAPATPTPDAVPAAAKVERAASRLPRQ